MLRGRVPDHLKPRFHLRPEHGWVNDPNGPVEHEGTLHLFFQSRPDLSLASPVEWGHATSTDWVTWTVHPSAIAPTVHPLAADGVYSGNTVSTPDGIRSYFSAFRHDRPYQTILTALSTDGGMTFGDARIAVPDPRDAESVAIYRDPFVWRDEDGWHLVVGVGLRDGTATVHRYASEDGLAWARAQDLVTAPAPDASPWGYMWECPQVMHDNGRTAVLVGVMDHAVPGFGPVLALTSASGSGSAPIDPSTVSVVDQGSDLYAASVYRRGDDGAIVWGWVQEARPEDWWTSDGWAGMISLPRETRIDDDGTVRSSPLDALTTLRAGRATEDAGVFTVGAQFEFSMYLETGTDQDPGTSRHEVVLRFGDREELRIVVDEAADEVVIDRSTASLDARADPTPVRASGVSGRGTVRGFVDGSVLELFVPNGAPVTCRFYPLTPPPWSVTGTTGTTGVTGTGAELDVWDLRQSVFQG